MRLYFLDTSVLVKRYVQGPGTERIEALFREREGRACIATVTVAEVAAAITRRMRGGFLDTDHTMHLLSAFRQHLRTEYVTIQVTDAVVHQAMNTA